MPNRLLLFAVLAYATAHSILPYTLVEAAVTSSTVQSVQEDKTPIPFDGVASTDETPLLGDQQKLEEIPVSYKGSQVLWVCPEDYIWRASSGDEGDDGSDPEEETATFAPLVKPPILEELVNQSLLEFWGRNETCWEYLSEGEHVEQVKAKLDAAKVPYEVVIDDLQRAIDTENPLTNEEPEDPEEEISDRKRHRMSWTMYHRLTDIHSYLDYLAQTYPFVSVGSLGTSVEGRPLKYVKISSGQANAKSFWIDGGIHAREWISPASVTYILSEIVENRDAHLKEIAGIDFYVLPVMNPDGYEYTHTRDRLWRKNRSRGSYYCQGTDLNRNFGYRWGGKGASKQQCQEIYGGRFAFSEPETKAVSNFIKSLVPAAHGFVTFHSYGQYILYPYGYDDNQLPPDHADLERVGRKIASAIRQVSGSQYTVGNSASTLYPASGGADDWAKGAANIKYSYTIELRDKGRYGFVLPSQYILPTAKEALASVKVISGEIQALP